MGEFAEEIGGGDATVHENVAAGDERAVGTHEERGDGGDLVQGAAAAHRAQLEHAPVSRTARASQLVFDIDEDGQGRIYDEPPW